MNTMHFLYAVKEVNILGDSSFSYPPFVAHSDKSALELVHEYLSNRFSDDSDFVLPPDNFCVFCIGQFDYLRGTVSGFHLSVQKMVFRVNDAITNYEWLREFYSCNKEGDVCE